MPTEVWQRGPVPGFDPYLMPVAHAFLQVKEDVEALAPRLSADRVWERPGGAASIGFHLRHIGGATERLLTYARGEGLTAEQVAAAKREGMDTPDLDALLGEVLRAIDAAIEQVRTTPRDTLLEDRKVGRAGLPSNTLGLLFHAAEHATRHMGQAITTARIADGR
ncbi:MAG: DinB family protein [Vicinamibacterales bacterium]